MQKILSVLCLTSLFPLAAVAATPKPMPVPGAEQSGQFQSSGAYAQAYYLPASESEFTGPAGGQVDFEGDGYGVSGRFPFELAGFSLFAVGEYSTIDYDEANGVSVEGELDEWRAGLGFQFNSDLGAYVQFDDRDSGDAGGADGYAVHGVYTLPLQDTPFSFYGDVGYFLLQGEDDGDIEGYEYTVGALYAVTPQFSGFVDYRGSDFDIEDTDSTLKYYDFRAGVRVNF